VMPCSMPRHKACRMLIRLLLSYCGVQTVDVRQHGAILHERPRSS
jgi:hypothetical protein